MSVTSHPSIAEQWSSVLNVYPFFFFKSLLSSPSTLSHTYILYNAQYISRPSHPFSFVFHLIFVHLDFFVL